MLQFTVIMSLKNIIKRRWKKEEEKKKTEYKCSNSANCNMKSDTHGNLNDMVQIISYRKNYDEMLTK